MVRERMARLRDRLKRENKKKVREIRMARKKELKYKLPAMLERYAKARIFDDDLAKEFKPGQELGPVIVGGNTSLLSPDEIAVLCRGPKFTIRRVLSKERFLIELEKAFVKIRWSKRDDDDENAFVYVAVKDARVVFSLGVFVSAKREQKLSEDHLYYHLSISKSSTICFCPRR